MPAGRGVVPVVSQTSEGGRARRGPRSAWASRSREGIGITMRVATQLSALVAFEVWPICARGLAPSNSRPSRGAKRARDASFLLKIQSRDFFRNDPPNALRTLLGLDRPLPSHSFGAGIKYFEIRHPPWAAVSSRFVPPALVVVKPFYQVFTLAHVESTGRKTLEDVHKVHFKKWSGRGDSNSRPLAPHAVIAYCQSDG